jgi:hypothetical protein
MKKTTNTGVVYDEQEIVRRLRDDFKLEFNDNDIVRTITHLQIPTVFSEQERDKASKIAGRVKGYVENKHGTLWIYVKRVRSLPLFVRGIGRNICGLFLLFLSIGGITTISQLYIKFNE